MNQHRTFPENKEKRKPAASTAQGQQKAAKITGGFRSDTPKNLTGPDRQKWLAQEIGYVEDLIRDLNNAFNESDSLSRRQFTALLFLSEHLLNRYAINIREMLAEEERRQAREEQATNDKVYLLANFRRDETGKRYSITGKVTDTGRKGGQNR